MMIELLQEVEAELLNSYNNRAHMQAAFDKYNTDLVILEPGGDEYAAHQEAAARWKTLKKSFSVNNFNIQSGLGEAAFSIGSPQDGAIARIAREVAKPEALKRIVSKIKN